MEVVLIPIVACLIPMVIVPTALAFKHARYVREVQHRERMKAMELGVVAPGDGLGWPAALACSAIGAGVPLGSFVVTWLASLTTELGQEIWLAPVLVSFVAIGAARKLADRAIAANSAAPASVPVKPGFDPESYDFAGSRA